MKTEKEEKVNLEIEERKGCSELTKGNRSWRASGGRVGRTSKLLGRLRRRSFDVVYEGSLAVADARRHFRSLYQSTNSFSLKPAVMVVLKETPAMEADNQCGSADLPHDGDDPITFLVSFCDNNLHLCIREVAAAYVLGGESQLEAFKQ